MVRSDRNWPDVYFGSPGGFLKLPWPRGDIDKGYERQLYDFATASGQHIVSTMLGGSRSYSMTWNALHVDTYRLLSQYWMGQMGYGPWAFIDPSAPNLLMPNQAAAGNFTYDTTGFSVNSLGSLNTNNLAVNIHRTGATRSIQWLFSSAPGSTFPVLTCTTPYKNWWGIPVVPGLSYVFSGWLKTNTGTITAALKLNWLDANGASLSQTSSGDIVRNTTFAQQSVVGVAPAGAYYVLPIVVLTGTTITAGNSLFVDELLMEQDTVVNNWAPGTGVRAVEITALNDPVAFNARFRKGVTMSLRELG